MRSEAYKEENGGIERRSARVIPFAKGRRSGASVPPLPPPDPDAEEREDLWLFVCLAGAFVVGLIRLVYAIHHQQHFGADASLALVFVLGVPLLLRESVVNFAGRLSRWVVRRVRHQPIRSSAPGSPPR